jgi:hypothetical protein
MTRKTSSGSPMRQTYQSRPALNATVMEEAIDRIILETLRSEEGVARLQRVVQEVVDELPDETIKNLTDRLCTDEEDTITFLDAAGYEEAIRQHLRTCKGIEVLARGVSSFTECELCFAHVASTSVCRDLVGGFGDPVYLCDGCIREIWSRTRTPATGANVDLPVTMKRGGVKA